MSGIRCIANYMCLCIYARLEDIDQVLVGRSCRHYRLCTLIDDYYCCSII